MTITKAEEIRREYAFKLNLIKSLLIRASNPPEYLVPTIREAVFSEIVNGAISYLGILPKGITIESPGLEFGEFEKLLFEGFNEALKKSKRKLSPRLKSNLLKMLDNSVDIEDRRDGASISCPFYDLFNGAFLGLFRGAFHSVVQLPFKYVHDGEKFFIQELDEREKSEIVHIGNYMKPLMKADIESIRKNFHY